MQRIIRLSQTSSNNSSQREEPHQHPTAPDTGTAIAAEFPTGSPLECVSDAKNKRGVVIVHAVGPIRVGEFRAWR
jgi:hypothetical protein